MSKEKWNEVWKIMKSGRLEFDKGNSDILCTICKNVLINAHSGPCGCRYCLECVTKYFNEEGKICPGNTDYCTDELLKINQNITTDQSINRKILETTVQCPEENCTFKDKLVKMEDHMRICDCRSLQCPYFNMGCKNYDSINTNMKTHMLGDIVSHTKLLFEYINILKNDIKAIKEENVNLDKNNKDLMKSIIELQLKFENENTLTRDELRAIENKFVEEQKNSVELKKEMKILNEDLELLKNKTYKIEKSFNDCKLKCESENKEIKDKLQKIVKKSDEEQDNLIHMEKEMKMLNEEMLSLKNDASENKKHNTTKIDKINKLFLDLKSISSAPNQSILPQMIQEQDNCAGLLWCINKWTEKTEQAKNGVKYSIDSESFYSHKDGYKMNFSVWPNGSGSCWGTHLSIECRVIQGENDDNLPWPFTNDVTFELINQHTNKIHTISTLRYGDRYEKGLAGDIYYQRDNRNPMEKGKDFICYNLKFISLKTLLNNRSLIDNDQILIRCSVTFFD